MPKYLDTVLKVLPAIQARQLTDLLNELKVLGEIRKVVKEKDKEHIMKLTMGLAHEDSSEKLRESAVKLLNELAPDMGQELSEVFIVPEVRSLGMDPKGNVRQAVARVIVNISKQVSIDCFNRKIFPLYKDILTKDKEERVRKTCAEVVAEFTKVSPLDQTAQELQDLYVNFLQDTTTAFEVPLVG